ncbi:MAG: GerMN domain-containing protein [Treponema sp.]|nr:GerMN domain-containing protein [Treponema sp.]
MSALINTIFKPIGEFLVSPVKRNLLLIGILCLVALIDYINLGVARRTFLFYTTNGENVVVEDRMLKHSRSKEVDIIRYVEETLLGPVSHNLLPLMPRGTKLESLLFRDGVVYANFSDIASLPPAEGGETLKNFRTFYSNILRNFSYVNDVRFFIDGNSIFTGVFYIEN